MNENEIKMDETLEATEPTIEETNSDITIWYEEPEEESTSVLPWIGLGGGIAALGVGIYALWQRHKVNKALDTEFDDDGNPYGDSKEVDAVEVSAEDIKECVRDVLNKDEDFRKEIAKMVEDIEKEK